MAAKKCRALIRLVFAGLVALPFMAGSKPAAACAAEPFIGSLCLFAGNFAPRGWAFANGQLLAISQNTALFSILGTTYGGDGRTTFALPDLRGRAAISAGNAPGLGGYALGEKGGTTSTTLSQLNLPSHSHTATVTITGNSDSDSSTPSGSVWGSDGRTEVYYKGQQGTQVQMLPDAVDVAIGNTGGGNSFNTQSPYLTLNWIIALEGIYPSRN